MALSPLGPMDYAVRYYAGFRSARCPGHPGHRGGLARDCGACLMDALAQAWDAGAEGRGDPRERFSAACCSKEATHVP